MFTTSNNQELIYINGRGIVNNEVSSVTLSGEQIFSTRVPAADIYEASVPPDDQWLALAYREGGGNIGISVVPFEADGDSGRRLVSSSGRQPQWSPDGSEIFYISEEDSDLMVARVVSTSPFATEPAGIIAQSVHHSIAASPSYDIANDGQRFLILREVGQQNSDADLSRLDFVIVENWFEELKRLAPPDPQ